MPWAGLDPDNLRAPADLTPNLGRPGRLGLFSLIRDVFANDPDWSNLLLSNPYVEDDNNNEHWVPQRPLGRGAFGKVALFSKKNHLSEIIDNVAIKQRFLPHSPTDAQGIWRNHLAKEAFLHSQLTTNDRDRCIVPLRRYKYYAHMRQCRLYMEYAPYGSLETLRIRYRAWDRFLPELFLWCIFEKLVQASLLMRTCPGEWEPMRPNNALDQPDQERFILHLDIKPDNIFIMERERLHHQSRKLPLLPLIQLGDFGLAAVTTLTDRTNPDELQSGTPIYKPPEAPDIHKRLFDDGWQRFVHRRKQKFMETHNVWCIGKTMFDLMTHEDPGFIHQTLMKVMEADYYSARGFPLSQHFTGPIETIKDKEYSLELLDLVRECLRPNMYLRPVSAFLLPEIQQHKQKCIEDIKSNHRGRRPLDEDHVRLTTAEMNKWSRAPAGGFPPGNPANALYWEDWKDLRRDDYLAPDEPVLEPPRDKWATFYARELLRPFRRNKPDVYGKTWKQAGNVVRVKTNASELDDGAGKGLRARRVPKRLRSWDENVEQDTVRRARLQDLRNRTRDYAGTTPFALVDYVLTKSSMNVTQAEKVLGWIYGKKPADPNWGWDEDEDVTTKAERVRERMLQDGVRKRITMKECMYLVAMTEYGVEQVDEAVRQMQDIFAP